MRVLILLLVLAVGPSGPVLCLATCASAAPAHQASIERVSCHEQAPPTTSDGARLGTPCRHEKDSPLLAQASTIFQLSIAPAVFAASSQPTEHPFRPLEARSVLSASSPPLVLPLRI